MHNTKSFKEYLSETPIGDYKTFGDWSKNSSFRDKRDRALIQHPTSIARMKKKFDNSNVNFNLFFVNSKEANRHTEVGVVDIEVVRRELGDEVADAVENAKDRDDSINMIFTNNKGSERKPFTAWMAAHRMGHAFARKQGMTSQYSSYKNASNHLISNISSIMQDYGIQDFPDNEDKILRGTSGYSYNRNDVNKVRHNQRAMIHFFHKVATFKSARDENLRDWFEVLNELIAQYLTTGRIKFNPAPQTFGKRGFGKGQIYHLRDKESADSQIDTLSRDMELMIDDILSSLLGSILIM